MKNLFNAFLCVIVLFSFVPTYAAFSERLKAEGESAKGSTQNVIGKMTDNPKLKAKGKINQAKGSLRHSKEDAKDIIND